MQKRKIITFLLAILALITTVIVPVGAIMTSEEQAEYDSVPIVCPDCGAGFTTCDNDGNVIPMTWDNVKDSVDYDTAENYYMYCDNCCTEVTFHFWSCRYSGCRVCLPTDPGEVCPECHALQVISAEDEELIYGAGDAEYAYFAGSIYGYERGKTAGESLAYDRGYADGYSAGKADGDSDGTGGGSSGETGDITGTDAYQAGLAAGRQQVLDELEATATTNKYYLAGVNAGYTNGYTKGYEDGEKAGYKAGYKIGYDEGYQKALKKTASKFQFGVFAYCHFNAILGIPDSSGTTQTYTVSDLNMSFGYGYVYVGQAAVNQINAGIASATGSAPEYDLAGLDWVKIECVFDTTFDWHSMPLYITGDSEIQDLSIISESGDLVTCNYEYKSSGSFSQFMLPDSWIGPFHCKRAILYIGRPVDLLQSFSLYSPSGQFYTGYDVGYAEGKKDTTDQAREEYFQLGYQQGLAKGTTISKNGTFTSLMAAVIDAPITAFSSLLNFEILGMNMKGFVTSIMTLLLIVIILKKLI